MYRVTVQEYMYEVTPHDPVSTILVLFGSFFVFGFLLAANLYIFQWNPIKNTVSKMNSR